MTCPHANNQACETSAVCPVKVYLANLAVLNAKLHNLHWNVVGRAFIQVHEYTEGLYDELFEQFDARGRSYEDAPVASRRFVSANS